MKIAIASGKGGTGKTTLSTNLAVYLSESARVALGDLDVEEPNSGLYVQGEEIERHDKFKYVPRWNPAQCDLCGTCQLVCNFNAVLKLGQQIMVFPELCHGCYACSELCPTGSLPMIPQKMGELTVFRRGPLDFVESQLNIGEEQAVPLIKQTLKQMNGSFGDREYLIYDSPPGTSCPVIEVTKEADLVILVTEPTPFGLHDLKLAVETMRELGVEFGVVINRHGLGDDRVERYCAEQSIDIITTIPNHRKIAELYSRGELLYPSIPEVKNALEKIRLYILERRKESRS
ncbi:MAG TPA: ATPase [Sediminispirochaeta sp.]|nr:ATPase [Sediminispirochaeta sp.]